MSELPKIAVAAIANSDEIGREDRAELANVAHRGTLGRRDHVLLTGALGALPPYLNRPAKRSHGTPCTLGKLFGEGIIPLNVVDNAFAFFEPACGISPANIGPFDPCSIHFIRHSIQAAALLETWDCADTEPLQAFQQ